ncbi:MAG: YdgA family protein [Candidatus Accumulibacter sp.]|nr:YdgA family protein [Accumulibacter sp.]
MIRKNIILAAVVAVVLAAAYPASSWYFGRQIETMLRGQVDARVAAQSFVKLVRHDYERGVFSAEETITFEIPFAPWPRKPPVPTAPEAAESGDGAKSSEAPQGVPPTSQPVPKPLPSLRFTLKNAIRHGPWLDSGVFGAASATTVVEFDETIQKKALEAFGGKPPLEIRTLYDFAGVGRGTAISPRFSIALPGGTEAENATLSGDGLEVSGEFTQDMERYSGRGNAPRFELLLGDGSRLKWTGLGIEIEQQRLFPDEPLFYIGTRRFSLDALEIEPRQPRDRAKPPKVTLKALKFDDRLSASGEFVDLVARIGAAGFTIGEQDYGPVACDISLKHLRARALASLNRKLMDLYGRPETLQDRERLSRALEPMKDEIIGLLLDDSVLSIDRIAFHMPGGEANFSVSASLAGADAKDFDSPAALIEKLEATAELALPASLVEMLTQAGEAKDEEGALNYRKLIVDEMIARLVRHGYVTDDNGVLKSRLVLKAGRRLQLNGKPFDPMALLG